MHSAFIPSGWVESTYSLPRTSKKASSISKILSKLKASMPKMKSMSTCDAALPFHSTLVLKIRSDSYIAVIQIPDLQAEGRSHFQTNLDTSTTTATVHPPSKLLPMLSSQWSGVWRVQDPDKEKQIPSPKKLVSFCKTFWGRLTLDCVVRWIFTYMFGGVGVETAIQFPWQFSGFQIPIISIQRKTFIICVYYNYNIPKAIRGRRRLINHANPPGCFSANGKD